MYLYRGYPVSLIYLVTVAQSMGRGMHTKPRSYLAPQSPEHVTPSPPSMIMV